MNHEELQIEIGRLRGIIRENEAGYADILQTLGREYDRAKDREQSANTYTRQAFCAGMVEAYKDALVIVAGANEKE